MAELFTNMARSRLASAITNSALSLTVATGDGNNLFPALGVGDYCRCVLLNLTTGNTEVIKFTARIGSETRDFTLTLELSRTLTSIVSSGAGRLSRALGRVLGRTLF